MVYSSPHNIESDMTRVFDEALETLRWARLHFHEPQSSHALRELEAKLGYLAQAMIWHTEGEEELAQQAIGLAQGKSLREQDAIRQMWEEMWWSH